jgi:hypothetical protein
MYILDLKSFIPAKPPGGVKCIKERGTSVPSLLLPRA